MSFLTLVFFNENFAFWLKNDIYCFWFMVLLNHFCDNLYWAWYKLHVILYFAYMKCRTLL